MRRRAVRRAARKEACGRSTVDGGVNALAATLVSFIAMLANLMPPPAAAQAAPSALLEGVAMDDVANALYQRCRDAGMAVESADAGVILCGASLDAEERLLGDVAIANVHEGSVRHRVRFALADRAEGVRVWADSWIEIREPDGVVLDHEIRSQDYLARVQSVLSRVGEALQADTGAAPREPWADHYQSEDAWRLDAHLRAVEYCDHRSDELSAARIDRRLELTQVQPFSRNLRGRCEELYEPVFQWGLARGIAEPGVRDYVDYRAALPAEERCAGRLALDAACE